MFVTNQNKKTNNISVLFLNKTKHFFVSENFSTKKLLDENKMNKRTNSSY